MAFAVGDRVEQQAQSTRRPARAGVVEEVVRGDPAPRYRIRWNDGHESIYAPASAALHSLRTPKDEERDGGERALMSSAVELNVPEVLYGRRSGTVERLSGV